MQTIRPFIELKWHTVPLAGELKRLENGKKSIPKFEQGWKEKYTKEFNEKETALGGVITGKCSNIIAIDCDNTITYEMIRALDPDYAFHFVSNGKTDALGNPQDSGTILYQYTEQLAETYSVHNGTVSMDFYSNGGFIYLPTVANETKKPFVLTELKEIPAVILALIKSLKPVKQQIASEVLRNKRHTNHLAPLVDRFISQKKIIPELFKILTPYDFRSMSAYLTRGFIVPDDVPEGRGSEYLSKISAILGADESVSVELYISAMELINSFFSQPMPKTRLNATIIDRMVEGKACIDNKPIWQYNEQWESTRITLVSKRNSLIDAFYDPDRMRYYLADLALLDVKSFKQESEFNSYINTVMVSPPDNAEIRDRLSLVNVTSTPAYPFGFYGDEYVEYFNTFTPTPALAIFKDPEKWAKDYTRPVTILNYLQSLVPDNFMRNYLLQFLRRKLDTFEYSPTILYFLGVSGAGKDTFVSLVESLIGVNGLARPTTKEFLEMYNGWILDKYFVQLDEYGNQLSRYDEKDAALGKIKAYTGKPEIQIRQMRTDGYNYIHSVTFIMTANKNPLMLDADDRRVAIFNCPNKLADELWVQTAGGMAIVYQKLQTEINDFAYYLATEVDSLSLDQYMEPPETLDKKVLIASKFSAGQKIAFLLSSNLFDELEKLAREYDVPQVFNGVAEGRIYEDDLYDLYDEMTEGKGTKRGLTAAMKEFDKVPTTKNGTKAYYYHVPGLRGFKLTTMSEIVDAEVPDSTLNI